MDWDYKNGVRSVTDIDYNDLRDYWSLLEERGAKKDPPSDMAGTKKHQKTLLNKLLLESRTRDFPQLPDLVYPKIKSKVDWEAPKLTQTSESSNRRV